MPGLRPDICETVASALSDYIMHLMDQHVTEPFRRRTASNDAATMFLTIASYAERDDRTDIAKLMHSYASRAKASG